MMSHLTSVIKFTAFVALITLLIALGYINPDFMAMFLNYNANIKRGINGIIIKQKLQNITHMMELEALNITFIEPSSLDILKHSSPPCLISYSASGNTFTRLLLERSTLFWTGSVSRSALAQIGFKGQGYTNSSVIVIKSHLKGRMSEKVLNEPQASAIFIVRDVFKTCWSHFQHEHAHETDQEMLNKYTNPGVLTHISSFIMSADTFNSTLLAQWNESSLKCVNDWLRIYNQSVDKMKQDNKSFVIVQFEKLLNPQYRQYEMKKILRFIFSDDYLTRNQQKMLQRMEQTIENIASLQRAKLIYRNKKRDNRIDIKYAYSVLSDEHLCKMLQKAHHQTILNVTHAPRTIYCG